MEQQTLSARRLARFIGCATLVLTIWGVVGWWFHTTAGWLAVVTGCCVGIYSWCERCLVSGRRLKLLDVTAIMLFCWSLIIAGRFVSTVAGVNHSVVWLAHRSAADEDGIAILAGDISEEREEVAEHSSAGIHSDSVLTAQSEEDLREAQARWRSMNLEEKAWFLRRWRVIVDGANQMAWSMIYRNSFAVAYDGTNLLWHLAGIAVALGLSTMPSQNNRIIR